MLSEQSFCRSSPRPFFPPRAAFVLSAIPLALLVTGIAHGVPRSRPGTPASDVVARAGGPRLPAYRLVPGERICYRLDYTGTSRLDLQGLFRGKSSVTGRELVPASGLVRTYKTTVQGELVSTVLATDARGGVIAYHLRRPSVSVEVNGQATDIPAEAIQRETSRDVFALVNLQGRVLSVQFDPAVGEFARGIARVLLAGIQFVLPTPERTDLRQWVIQEDDRAGRYIAHYQAEPGLIRSTMRGSAAAIRAFRKAKVRYLAPARASKWGEWEVQRTVKPSGSLTARFDLRNGHLVSLNGAESQVLLVARRQIARTDTRLRMECLRLEALKAWELAGVRAAYAAREKVAAAIPLWATASQEASEAAIQRNELGNANLDSLLECLARMEGFQTRSKDDTALYLKFKALVYLQPRTSARLGKMLVTTDPTSIRMRILAGALGAVGHPDAQRALAIAIRARQRNWPALSRLIPTLGAARFPTEEAEETVRDLAFHSSNRDIASTAQLALGTMARNLGKVAPKRAARILERVTRELGAAPSQGEIRQWLLVLGNAGATSTLSTIARFTTHPSPTLRATATSALRWIHSHRADTLLARALTSDPDGRVRLEAAVALGYREPTAATVQTQRKALLADKNVNVRLAVLGGLWQVRESFPEVRRVVKWAAAKDASKDVRKAAAAIMATYPSGLSTSARQTR
jgi:hypothetical protein